MPFFSEKQISTYYNPICWYNELIAEYPIIKLYNMQCTKATCIYKEFYFQYYKLYVKSLILNIMNVYKESDH